MKKLLIVIPAFNEEKVIKTVLNNIPKKIQSSISVDRLVIDDGSTDKTGIISSRSNTIVVRHFINRGLGAALATGFKYAIIHNYDFVVTFDADGQHSIYDIKTVLMPLLKQKVDVVIGTRIYKNSSMPMIRKIVNYFSNFVTLLLFNIWTTDSQSGLRAFTVESLRKIKIRSQRMEVSSEIYKEISRLKLSFTEVPIQSIYTRYSLQKGQKISNAPNVFWKLLLNKFG